MGIRALLRAPRRFLVLTAMAATVTTACQASAGTAGNPADFALNVWTGWVQRWNPCASVHYRVELGAESAALPIVQSAVGQVSRATGITFVYDGPSSFVPSGGTGTSPRR